VPKPSNQVAAREILVPTVSQSWRTKGRRTILVSVSDNLERYTARLVINVSGHRAPVPRLRILPAQAVRTQQPDGVAVVLRRAPPLGRAHVLGNIDTGLDGRHERILDAAQPQRIGLPPRVRQLAQGLFAAEAPSPNGELRRQEDTEPHPQEMAADRRG